MTIGPDQGGELAFVHRQRDIPDDELVPVAGGNTRKFEGGVHLSFASRNWARRREAPSPR